MMTAKESMPARHSRIDLAKKVLETEAKAISALIERLDSGFEQAVELILDRKGRVIVSGIGKSGHIARKIASTMASTGTPAYFVHPAEASHGDLGMITKHDVLVAISYSGESAELLAIVPLIKRRGAKLISMTGNANSTLAKEADVHLDARVEEEACPLGLAPTASTTAALALGDALAIALLDAKGFGPEDFARSHPGGALGARLLTHVSDVMRKGDAVPLVPHTASLSQAILEMSQKKMGMTAIVDEQQRVVGIFTDGDLRRALDKIQDFHKTMVMAVMTPNPRAIRPEQLAVEAVQVMESYKINQLLVVDPDLRLQGALNMHDLFHAKIL